MASGLFLSLQSLSCKLLDAVCGSGDDPNKIKSIEEDLKWLSRKLPRIVAVQQDAEEREIRDRSVELWLRELRGVAHEAEDVLDEYHYQVLKSTVENPSVTTQAESSHIGSRRKFKDMSAPSSLASSSSNVAKIMIPDGMTDNIKRIRELFEEISRDRDALHLREGDGERRILGPQNRPHTSSLIDEKGLFGRENEKEKIISLITPANGPDFMVLPIVGKGGLGKTTLAQLVYNDSEVNRLFDKKAWVSVLENFDIVRITRAIIEEITEKSCGFSELSKLQVVLKGELADKRLFLVLDDVWNEKNDLWECFRIVFSGAKTVKILATTRSYSVAEIMQTVPLFELGDLPEDKCWMIFKHRAFDNHEINKQANLIQIGRDIVKKCKGLPLYAKVLGGLLQYETDEEKWREVLESEICVVDEKNEIMSALSLSYHYMPVHLRSCFLYLSMFPKGTKLQKNMVVNLWMAHGYINTRPTKTLEDIGCEYFEELRCRSLIDCINGYYYVLHDLIHDLAVSINERMYPTLHNSSFPIYHLYLNYKENTVPSYITTHNHRSVRTLLNSHVPQINHTIILSMVRLRVLTLYVDDIELPDSIGILKHLRYLEIIGYGLPESLCILYNLQTLELRSDSILELPRDIGNLINLRHLLIESLEIQHLPESLCVLYNLQTLQLYSDSLLELPRDIGNLINLRHLFICSHEIEHLPESICYLYNLQTLKLTRCCNLKELPSRMELLMSLRELCVECINMPCGFCKLPNLHIVRGTLNARGDKLHRGLGELKFLNNLDESLYIIGIENITNVEYAKEASLKSKSNLKCLRLYFSTYCMEDNSGKDLFLLIKDPSSTGSFKKNNEIQESVLESLQPHGNIKELRISDYRGTKYPSWLGDHLSLPKLTELSLVDCWNINLLLLSLKLPALEKLSLSFMPEWCEWTGVLDDNLPFLKTLEIEYCGDLRIIPTIPKGLRNLYITKCGLHEIRFPFSFTLERMKITDCQKFTSIIGLNSQKSLKNIYLYMRDEAPTPDFSNISDDYISSVLVCAKDVLTNPILERPSFQKSMALDLPVAKTLILHLLDYYKCVKHLCIIGCPKLRHWKDVRIPEMLEYLEVSCCDELITIPPLHKNKSLLEIRIWNCPKLRAIRAERCLFSLRTLLLKDCQKLREMPSEILKRRPQTIQISNCPRLKDWCQENDIPTYKDGEGSSSMIDCVKADL